MSRVATRVVACNACGSREATPVARSIDFEYATCDNEFEFVRCATCSLVYLRNRPEESELRIIYPPDYIPYHFNEHLGPWIARLRGAVQRRKIAPIRAHAPAGSVIVDVGCGSGELLRILRDQGDPSWRLLGVDFAPEAIANLERLGIEARAGRFESLEWKGPRPNVLILNQVIEHLDDPAAVVRRAFELLLPGGVLVIETPSTDGWDARLFRRRYWGGWHTPRHWVLYDERTLGALLRGAGFEIAETRYLLSPNFWLQSLHHWALERLGAPRLAGWFDVSVLPALLAATALDAVQLAVRGRTSNFRMVGRKVA